MRRPPTDFEILRAIYERHRGEYARRIREHNAKVFVPINIPAIAGELGVDENSVFGRLYYHLDPLHGEARKEGQPRKAFFTPRAGDEVNCVNFPHLEAVLAALWDDRRRNQTALVTAGLSIGISIASLIVAISA